MSESENIRLGFKITPSGLCKKGRIIKGTGVNEKKIKDLLESLGWQFRAGGYGDSSERPLVLLGCVEDASKVFSITDALREEVARQFAEAKIEVLQFDKELTPRDKKRLDDIEYAEAWKFVDEANKP
ncbi:MAG: hypothetical protein WC806_02800 [Candidatus Gracilibacteria bacterium]|jgi:hypothetical protein